MTSTRNSNHSDLVGPLQLVGLRLSASQLQMLKLITRNETPPQYVAVRHSREYLAVLLAALHSPAETTYATCVITDRDVPFVAVPFEALKQEARFVLECIYLFSPQDAPQNFHKGLSLQCAVTEFTAPVQGDGTHTMLSLSVAPPWEALPPVYVGCMERAGRIGHLQPVLGPQTFLERATLLDEDRPADSRVYRVAPYDALQKGARAHLEQVQLERPIFFCLYDSRLRTHPLLALYWRRFILCRVGEEASCK